MTESLRSGEAPASGSGTLTVIKAGPGFHSQKTYNFGPEGVNSKTEEKTGQDVGKDMRKSARLNGVRTFIYSSYIGS